MHTHQYYRTLGWLLLVALLGCGSNDGRLAVDGSITLDGKPLSAGVISFRPVLADKATTAGSGIEEGRYRIPAAGGLMPGEYKVVVQAFEETGRMVDDPQFGQTPETVPVKFNEVETLRATVTADGPNRFDFALTRANQSGK